MKLYRSGAFVAMVLALLSACGQGQTNFGEAANTAQTHVAGQPHTAPSAATQGGLQPVLATSELVVGPNRMALGILENNVPIEDAAQTAVKVRYFKINGDQATVVGEEQAQFYGENLGPRGTFITHPTFDTPGKWGLEVQAQRPGQPVDVKRIAVDVVAKGRAPMVGSAAPRSKTATAGTIQDISTITSAAEPDLRLYQLSVDQAVTSGKPSLVLFATPGFCETAVCGPDVEVVRRLLDTFGDKLNAVHVEIYQYPFEKFQFVPAMQEWGLQSEPWLFLVDKEGRIANRYEGGITYQELEPDVTKLVQ